MVNHSLVNHQQWIEMSHNLGVFGVFGVCGITRTFVTVMWKVINSGILRDLSVSWDFLDMKRENRDKVIRPNNVPVSINIDDKSITINVMNNNIPSEQYTLYYRKF